MKKFAVLFALCCACAISTAALADTFTYTYTAASVVDGGFTYTSPTLITTATTFIPTTCLFGSQSCSTVFVDPNSGVDPIYGAYTSFLYVTFVGSPFLGFLAKDAPTSFYETVGATQSYSGTTLMITDNVAAAPEPASFLLLGTGLVGIGGALRRRFAA